MLHNFMKNFHEEMLHMKNFDEEMLHNFMKKIVEPAFMNYLMLKKLS